MEDWKHDRIGAAERGENPTVVLRMPSGIAVMGDTQFLPTPPHNLLYICFTCWWQRTASLPARISSPD